MTTSTTKQKKTLPLSIGADPEFLLFYGTRGLDAQMILGNFFNNNSQYTRENSGYDIPNVGNFGWDGASSTGELRPVPTNDIDQMVQNLGVMLKTIHTKLPFIDITTLSIGSPIGGHIHLDDFVYTLDESQRLVERIPGSARRIKKLMSTYLMPIVASDHRVSALSRLSSNYGRLSDIRYEKKGQVITAEIRGLTAEWLTSPKIAHATFAYLATIWHEFKLHNKELAKDKNLLRTDDHTNQLQRLMLADYNILEKVFCSYVKNKVKTFELYPIYKEEIDFILNPQKVIEEKENAGWNIAKGWKFDDSLTKPNKKNILAKTAVAKAFKKTEFPNLDTHFPIPYNDDYRVADFSRAISQRVAGLNWQLNNEYFLFGLRKPLRGYTITNSKEQYFCVSELESHESINSMMSRMASRANQSPYGRGSRVDPKTGKVRQATKNRIIIGIPYSDREKLDFKPMLSLIWEIESGKLEAKSLNSFPEVLPEQPKNTEVNFTDIISDIPVDLNKYNVDSFIPSNQEYKTCAD